VIECVGGGINGGINGGSVVDIGSGEDGISDEKEHILYPFMQR
jgi:hypothetical protein